MVNHTYKIEARRREVNLLLARNWTQTQIAKRLGCDPSTISDDVRALKETAQDYIFGLAKNTIAFEYKQCLDSIQNCKDLALKMFEAWNAQPSIANAKYRLSALKLAKDCDLDRFACLLQGPSVLQVKQLENRLSQLEKNHNEATSIIQ